jgi:hypothetical protein
MYRVHVEEWNFALGVVNMVTAKDILKRVNEAEKAELQRRVMRLTVDREDTKDPAKRQEIQDKITRLNKRIMNLSDDAEEDECMENESQSQAARLLSQVSEGSDMRPLKPGTRVKIQYGPGSNPDDEDRTGVIVSSGQPGENNRKVKVKTDNGDEFGILSISVVPIGMHEEDDGFKIVRVDKKPGINTYVNQTWDVYYKGRVLVSGIQSQYQAQEILKRERAQREVPAKLAAPLRKNEEDGYKVYTQKEAEDFVKPPASKSTAPNVTGDEIKALKAKLAKCNNEQECAALRSRISQLEASGNEDECRAKSAGYESAPKSEAARLLSQVSENDGDNPEDLERQIKELEDRINQARTIGDSHYMASAMERRKRLDDLKRRLADCRKSESYEDEHGNKEDDDDKTPEFDKLRAHVAEVEREGKHPKEDDERLAKDEESAFDKLANKVAKEPGYSKEDAKKVAYAAGVKKYGKSGMAKKAAAGREKHGG